ncbi:NADPH-dependent FMN reductase [Listeria booriae]|uniref:NAD(P)H-dependent oxidoreductase n=1 Tax=Listeria booriae TaxID=1552123 RepID=A0A7X0XJK9_9LIST|nr:NADPH-dependent FMN reductase [Listeria booriae]MBC1562231.1 NAD(P)H-dependent oxidoreductase [Listeria booriae]
MKVAILVGSLRENSYNKTLATFIQKRYAKDIDGELLDLNLPLYNEDLESDLPADVVAFKKKVHDADAVLFVTPEYNHSISGVLKNAIDWASRITPDLKEKPGFIVGASMGGLGTVRAQMHLRQILDTMGMRILPANEVFISTAHTKFDEKGDLIDEGTVAFLDSVVANFVAFYERNK